ncbi:MAG: hypothetical protein JWP17_4171, partial [Solirubrobacterales bacterium]|nr:hypothetical protein [Solirubrobacterales bacterium]
MKSPAQPPVADELGGGPPEEAGAGALCAGAEGR